MKMGRAVTTTDEKPKVCHARIELPSNEFDRLKKQADRYRLSVSAYIRQAVMERIERDEDRVK